MLLTLLACQAPATFSDAQTAVAQTAAARVNGSALMDHVKNLIEGRVAEEPYQPPESRYAGMTFTHLNSADYVAGVLASYGLTPVVTVPDGERGLKTVTADIPGASHADEIVLVSAHHDAWYFGADDNASGVAVILEVARVLADTNPDRTIRIASFDREEEGLVGAAAYADAGTDGLYRIVNLDSVAYTDSTPGSQKSILGLDAPDTGDFLAVIAAEGSQDDLAAVLALGPTLPQPVKTAGVLANGTAHSALETDLLRSDHAPFWARGVGGVFLTDTTEFRNPKYHTPEDTLETLDPEFFTQVGGFTAAIVAAYAEAE